VGGDERVSAEFVSGATMVASLVIAAYFFRYWRQTRDRLFLMFAGGFLVFAASRLILAFLDEDDEGRVFVYALRLLAFALILAAIIDKNRTRRSRPGPPSANGHRPPAEASARRTPTRF
jgi:drug/metabolite transporter superfamily protein YnfA